MEVDGKVINNKNLRSWQTKIGYGTLEYLSGG